MRGSFDPMLVLAAGLILTAFLLIVHHAAVHGGVLFQASDVDNHETLIVGLSTMAVGVLITIKHRGGGRGH